MWWVWGEMTHSILPTTYYDLSVEIQRVCVWGGGFVVHPRPSVFFYKCGTMHDLAKRHSQASELIMVTLMHVHLSPGTMTCILEQWARIKGVPRGHRPHWLVSGWCPVHVLGHIIAYLNSQRKSVAKHINIGSSAELIPEASWWVKRLGFCSQTKMSLKEAWAPCLWASCLSFMSLQLPTWQNGIRIGALHNNRARLIKPLREIKCSFK